jgi:hypothetical protein
VSISQEFRSRLDTDFMEALRCEVRESGEDATSIAGLAGLKYPKVVARWIRGSRRPSLKLLARTAVSLLLEVQRRRMEQRSDLASRYSFRSSSYLTPPQRVVALATCDPYVESRDAMRLLSELTSDLVSGATVMAKLDKAAIPTEVSYAITSTLPLRARGLFSGRKSETRVDLAWDPAYEGGWPEVRVYKQERRGQEELITHSPVTDRNWHIVVADIACVLQGGILTQRKAG